MNIKDSYIHNGTAVLKDVKVENSVLKKILAGKDANDAYLGWETVCDLTGIKPKAAGTADKVGHKLTFSGGVTGTWDGSAEKTVVIPTKSSWNYDDVYLKLTGNGTTNPLTGTIYIKDVNGIILNSTDKDLNIWEVYGASGTWTSQFGFNLQYLGTSSGNNNDLILWAHNQTGTHVETYRVKQDGTFIFKAAPKVGTNVMYHAGNLTASVIGSLGTLSNNISGNAATTTKFETSRTIWGQSFDGTKNISGALTEVTDITASGNINCANLKIPSDGKIYNGGYYGLYINGSAGDYGSAIYLTHDHGKNQTAFRIHSHYDSNLGGLTIGFSTTTQNYGTSPINATYDDILHIRGNGNIGIGTTSPSYKLHVVGDIYTTTGFKKKDSSDSYVLLGGGGHKLISAFSMAHDHPYLPLSGGTMSNTNKVTNLNADLLDGYHASSFYQNKTLHSDQDSIYDLRFNYGQYDKGDFNGTYKDEYPTNYGSYIALTARDKNIGALMFFDAPISNKLGHIYVRTRGAGDSNTTYSEWGTIAYLTDNVASSSKWVNARTITLTGSVTGSVSIDGSSNVTLSTTTNHTHTKSQITDFPTSLPANGGNADRAKFLETFHQNSTINTYGSQYPIWAQWSDSANVRLKCTNYTVWTDKATTAITATKIGTSTVGSASMPVYINSGTPTAITSFPEAYLSWGGKNFSGSYGPIDAAMIPDLGACRSMFAKAEGITVQYSRNGGSTWVDYGLTDTQKTALFSVGQGIVIGGTTETGIDKSNYKSRVIVTTNLAGIYTMLNKIAIYVSTNGSNGCNVTIDARTKANVDAGNDTWTTLADSVPVNGWSGWNIINIPSTTTYGNTSAQYQQIRFTFSVTSHASTVTYPGLSVSRIMMFGGAGWIAPSNMAKNGHLYSFDQSQNATFPAAITSTMFKKSGGTSSQFLKADGSVDSNTYSKSSHTHTFSSLTSKPTTISGYGITDALKIDGSNGTAVGVSALINKLDTGSSTPTDADYYICQYVGGGTTTTTYHRRPMSAMWNWIKAKTDTLYPTKSGTGASGTWSISITGNAKTATTSTYASNVGSSGTAGTNYVTATNVISMYNWYNSITATDEASNTAIDKWNEIVSFLAGITDTSTLSGILAGYAAVGHNHDKTYLKLSGGNVTGRTTIRKDLTGNLSDWVSKQHLGPFEVGRATNSMCVAIGVTDDNYGYIQVKGANITTPGNLVLLPGGGNLTVGNATNTVYHKGNLSIATLMGSTAIGDSDEPVYWNGAKFIKAGAYPTKSSWNYDDRYLKLSGGTLTGTLTINTYSDRSLILDEPSGEKYHIISFRANGEEYASLCSNYLNSENNLIFNGNIIYHSGNLPAYPKVNNGALYLQANGDTKVTFTANQSSNSTLNIATGSANGTISVGGTNVSVKGLGSNAYTSTAYLPLAGGIMDDNAQIKRKGRSGSWVGGRDRAIIRETSSSGYHPLFSLKTKDGSWELGEYNTSGLYNVPIFSYVTDTDYSNGNNTTTYQIKYPLASGTIALTADLKWSNISSKPETATRWPSWSEVTNKPSTFPVSEHNHDGRYLRWNGSAADVSAMAWGTLTAANGYTILSHAASSDGGDWGMVNKGGKIYMQLDGYYYQNEGQYRVTDVSETVTALGTNGNYLTWTKNGTTNNITIPYATKAGSANSATGSEYLNNYSITNPNSDAIKDNKVKWFAQINSSSGYAGNNYGFPAINNANGILYLGTHPGKYGHQLGFSSNGNIYHRYQNGSDFPNTANGGSWEILLTSNNYTTYTVKKDGTGASGTWGISITGNAKTATNIAWSGVTDKPAFTTWSETSSASSYSLSNAAWTNTITLPTTAGSYILNIVSGNSTLTGVFSIGASDNAKDEISLHLHGNGPRLYARTNGTTLQLSSNDASATSRSVTIKYRRMI